MENEALIATPNTGVEKPKSAPFLKVSDGRGNFIRGLWIRNSRYYIQIRLPGKKASTRVALRDETGVPVQSIQQAKISMAKMEEAKAHRKPVISGNKKLGAWIDYYLDFQTKTEAKKENSIYRERCSLVKWKEKLGHVQLLDLQVTHINQFCLWRKEKHGVVGSTLNHDVIFLNNALNFAIQEGHLYHLPTDRFKNFEHDVKERPLWTDEQIQVICSKALELKKTTRGLLLRDFILFMAYSGSRRTGALEAQWSDVDWVRRQVKITSKNDDISIVDFNHRLEAHLKEMFARKQPDSEWLFPNCFNSDSPVSERSVHRLLESARRAAGAEFSDFQFHDMRHYFISSMVMSGIDFMTIAKWVHHVDGGVLIGKTYGHLNNEHLKKQAAKAFSVQKPPEENKENKELATMTKMLLAMQEQLAVLQAK
jgi:site-specific recombinase XerD